MNDLAVKCFMAANGMTDFDVAQNIMYKYGLAESYETYAHRLQFLLTDETSGTPDEAFAEGAEFVQEIVMGLRFHVPDSARDSEFVRGIEFAMDRVAELMQAAVDGANMTDADIDRETRVRDATMFPLDADGILRMVSALFDNRREPSSR